MDQTQIDVKYDQLLKWLEERYLIPKDWAKRVEAISLKKNELLEQLYLKTTDEFKKIQDTFKNRREVFNFDDLNRLFQMLLKTEEAKSKGLFGGYNSKLINDCNLIITLYNKNNVILCELSKNIIQSISYDIPDNNNQISTLERNINDNLNRIDDRTNQVDRNIEKIKAVERTYEIRSDQIISQQLISKLEKLPGLLSAIETMAKDERMKKIISSYENFYKEVHYSKTNHEMDSLVILKKLYSQGNYNVSNENISISMSDLIKSKIQLYSSNEDTQSWEIKIEGDKDNTDKSRISNDKKEIKTVLLDHESRETLISNINELFVFISHRLYLLTNKDEITLSMNQNNLREVNKEINQDFLTKSKQYLQEIIKKLNDHHLNFLLNLYNDKKYVLQIQSNVEKLKIENEKIGKAISEYENKNKEFKLEIEENKKKILNIKKEAKLIKKQMEKKMTDLLKRKITIIGDINLIE